MHRDLAVLDRMIGNTSLKDFSQKKISSMVKIKRVYDPPSRTDGVRILIDRLWPRGVSKQAARVKAWMRELGPSDELRQFFGHDPARWLEFRRRYLAELRCPQAAPMLNELRAIARKGTLTLVYGARDAEHNQAVVLKSLLEKKRQKDSH